MALLMGTKLSILAHYSRFRVAVELVDESALGDDDYGGDYQLPLGSGGERKCSIRRLRCLRNKVSGVVVVLAAGCD